MHKLKSTDSVHHIEKYIPKSDEQVIQGVLPLDWSVRGVMSRPYNIHSTAVWLRGFT